MKFILTLAVYSIFSLVLAPAANAGLFEDRENQLVAEGRAQEGTRLKGCLARYQSLAAEKVNALAASHGGAAEVDTSDINLNSIAFWSAGVEFKTGDGLTCKTGGFDVSTEKMDTCATDFQMPGAYCLPFDAAGNYVLLRANTPTKRHRAFRRHR